MNFKKLSNDLYFLASHHKFAKKPSEYDRGYMKIADWINDLCWHYMQKRKQLEVDSDIEFKGLVEAQRKKIQALDPSKYRDGLMRAVDDVV